MRFGLRELIFLIVLLAVPASALFIVFKPRNVEIQQALREIDTKRQRLDRLAQLTSQIDDIELLIIEGQESIQIIEEKLPSEQAIDEILQQVWQIADANYLIVRSVKSEKAVPAATYRELPLKMTLEGEFDGFYRFLLELEALPRITRILNLKLTRNQLRKTSDDGPQPTMKAEFTLSIYFDGEKSGDEEAPVQKESKR